VVKVVVKVEVDDVEDSSCPGTSVREIALKFARRNTGAPPAAWMISAIFEDVFLEDARAVFGFVSRTPASLVAARGFEGLKRSTRPSFDGSSTMSNPTSGPTRSAYVSVSGRMDQMLLLLVRW